MFCGCPVQICINFFKGKQSIDNMMTAIIKISISKKSESIRRIMDMDKKIDN